MDSCIPKEEEGEEGSKRTFEALPKVRKRP
jgi:hypothetical protein